MKNICSLIVMGMLAANVSYGQTTLSGNHIITGNLDVGTSGTNGNLLVTGQTGTNANPGIKVTGDGGVLFQGTFGTGKIPATNTGTRFMWYPKKAALRAGYAATNQWDDANIGNYSIALGAEAVASGEKSFSVGGLASGTNSIAIGVKNPPIQTSATGAYSVAIGAGAQATAYRSFAIGTGYASGSNSFAFGGTASGVSGMVLGNGSAPGSATGDRSIVIGHGYVTGFGSVSLGSGLVSYGAYTVALGYYNAYRPENSTNWVSTNALFLIGNGTGNFSDPTNVRYSDAFIIYKNADVEMRGKVKMPRQGDILMGEFGNGGGD